MKNRVKYLVLTICVSSFIANFALAHRDNDSIDTVFTVSNEINNQILENSGTLNSVPTTATGLVVISHEEERGW